jgi:acylphosphatase
MPANELKRATVYFAGHVQAVGFRYTTQSIARRFAVTGQVKNLPDGRVELVAEGERREIEAFLAEIRGHFTGQIRDELRDIGPATGEFDEFKISH